MTQRRPRSIEEWQFALRDRWYHAKVTGPPPVIYLTTMDDRGRVMKREFPLGANDASTVAMDLARTMARAIEKHGGPDSAELRRVARSSPTGSDAV